MTDQINRSSDKQIQESIQLKEKVPDRSSQTAQQGNTDITDQINRLAETGDHAIQRKGTRQMLTGSTKKTHRYDRSYQ